MGFGGRGIEWQDTEASRQTKAGNAVATVWRALAQHLAQIKDRFDLRGPEWALEHGFGLAGGKQRFAFLLAQEEEVKSRKRRTAVFIVGGQRSQFYSRGEGCGSAMLRREKGMRNRRPRKCCCMDRLRVLAHGETNVHVEDVRIQRIEVARGLQLADVDLADKLLFPHQRFADGERRT